MNFSPESMRSALQAHAELCSQMLNISSREQELLRSSQDYIPTLNDNSRRRLIADLDKSLEALKTHRMLWQQLQTSERAGYPDIYRLIRATQETGMKLIVLDRENEQALLRRGLLPARNLPSAQSQRPDYVADVYRRNRN